MRALFILILIGGVVWLFIERQQLSGDIEKLQAQIVEKDKEIAELKERASGVRTIIQPGGTRTVIQQVPGKNTWLDEHVDRGARALDRPARQVR